MSGWQNGCKRLWNVKEQQTYNTNVACSISTSAKAKVSGSVVAGFPSPAEQYLEPPLDLNELLVKRPRLLGPGTMMAVSWQSA